MESFRKRIIKTPHGNLKTPFFMPVGTKGTVRNLSPTHLKNELNSPVLLANTYHLYLKPGNELVKRMGGLHRFINWDRPILTDSGGYQVFSLSKIRKITEDGCEFRSHLDGSKHMLTPEKSIQIQLDLGSDIIMVLDECPPYPATREYIQASLELTTRWARRCKEYFEAYIQENNILPHKRPLLFGIVQGSTHEDLRKESLRQLERIGFDGYAIGGVSVGEERRNVLQVISWIAPLLPENKPRYLMGLGKPEEIVYAVSKGVDMFDCVIPSREARHGNIYVWKDSYKKPAIETYLQQIQDCKDGNLPELSFYGRIKIGSEQYKEDSQPLDINCTCYACKNYSRAYLRHLLSVKENVALQMLTIHNMHFYLEMMEVLRKI